MNCLKGIQYGVFVLIVLASVSCSDAGSVSAPSDAGGEVEGIIVQYATSAQSAQMARQLASHYQIATTYPEVVTILGAITVASCLAKSDPKGGAELAARIEAEVFKGLDGLRAYRLLTSSKEAVKEATQGAVTRQMCEHLEGPETFETSLKPKAIARLNVTENNWGNRCSTEYVGRSVYRGDIARPRFWPASEETRICRKKIEDHIKKDLDVEDPNCLTQCMAAPSILPGGCSTNECRAICARPVSIFFGNGMFTTLQDAVLSRDALEDKLCEFLPEKQLALVPHTDQPGSVVNLAYNRNEFILQQLEQLIIQKLGDEAQRKIQWLGMLYGFVKAPDWMLDLIRNSSEALSKIDLSGDGDLKEHMRQYNGRLESGSAILVVPHSQGNFYALEAARILQREFNSSDHILRDKNEFHVGILPVATPSSLLPMATLAATPYLNLVTDYLIRICPGSLPPNTRNSEGTASDHAFIGSYLNGTTTGPQIIQGITELIEKLKAPFRRM